jgi:hypothetical protein
MADPDQSLPVEGENDYMLQSPLRVAWLEVRIKVSVVVAGVTVVLMGWLRVTVGLLPWLCWLAGTGRWPASGGIEGGPGANFTVVTYPLLRGCHHGRGRGSSCGSGEGSR